MISGKEFANLLGVSAPALSQSVKKRHYCGQYKAYKYAVKDAGDRVQGYAVPPAVLDQLRNGGPRINPFDDAAEPLPWEPETEDAARRPDQVDKPRRKPRENPTQADGKGSLAGYAGTSVLPPGEDYFRPTVAAAAGVVLQTAMKQNNGTAKAMVSTGSVAIGALIGYEVSEKRTSGAFIGALVGVGLSAWAMQFLEQRAAAAQMPHPTQPPADELQRDSAAGAGLSTGDGMPYPLLSPSAFAGVRTA